MEKNAIKSKQSAKLVEGAVGRLLVKLTIPMIFGMISMVIFNLVDTFFVGQLGTKELAALSFTFPVVLVVHSLALGLGIGASVVISRAIGEGNHHEVQRLTTDALCLSVIIVAFFIIIGLFTIEPLFRLLGATPELLPLIKDYMKIWYFGMIFVVFPMVGNNAIRATGDTKTPALIMMFAALVNAILDPFLIFGLGPFPRLEIAGAAIATVIGRAITFIVALYVLSHREKMITLAKTTAKSVFDSWRRILYIGLPTAGTRMIIPIGIGVITRLIASYGEESVAAFGVSSRIEFFAISVIAALSVVLSPFVGQNWGASKYDRVKKGLKYSKQFSIGWGFAVFVLLAIFARPIAAIFSENSIVVSTIVTYLRIVPIGYGLLGILMLSTSVLNVLNKPIHATILSITQMFLLYIPMAFFGSYFFGIPGIFIALALSYFISGIAAHIVQGRIMEIEERIV